VRRKLYLAIHFDFFTSQILYQIIIKSTPSFLTSFAVSQNSYHNIFIKISTQSEKKWCRFVVHCQCVSFTMAKQLHDRVNEALGTLIFFCLYHVIYALQLTNDNLCQCDLKTKLKLNHHWLSLVQIKLENVAIAMHCNLRPVDAAGAQKRHIVCKRPGPICTKFGEDTDCYKPRSKTVQISHSVSKRQRLKVATRWAIRPKSHFLTTCKS